MQSEIMKVKGLVDAEYFRSENQSSKCRDELLREQINILVTMQDKLPEILKSFPTERYGETTLIQISGGEDNTFQKKSGIEILGLAYMPIVKQVMALLESKWGNSVDNSELDKVSLESEIQH
jgi:hypothetical protein